MRFYQIVGFLAVFGCVFAVSLQAQDEMAVASSSPCLAVAGNPIFVPIYVRDVSGTPLGIDQPQGKRIEGLSFQLAYTPAEAVKSVAIQRAGVLAKRVAVSEFAIANGNTVSYLGLFEEQFNTLQFHLDAPAPGDLIAYLVITLSPAALPGSRMNFAFSDSTTTSLTDQNGVTAETEGAGTLRTQNGCAQLVLPRHRVVRK